MTLVQYDNYNDHMHDFREKNWTEGRLYVVNGGGMRENCFDYFAFTMDDKVREDRMNIAEVYIDEPSGTMSTWCEENGIPVVFDDRKWTYVVVPETEDQKFLIKLRWL